MFHEGTAQSIKNEFTYIHWSKTKKTSIAFKKIEKVNHILNKIVYNSILHTDKHRKKGKER